MKQIIQAVQSFITKGKFILFLGTVFLFVSTAACAQVIASADEQAETVPESLWPEQEKVTPRSRVRKIVEIATRHTWKGSEVRYKCCTPP